MEVVRQFLLRAVGAYESRDKVRRCASWQRISGFPTTSATSISWTIFDRESR